TWMTEDASSKDGSRVFTGHGLRLQLDWISPPGPSALGAWKSEEPSVRAGSSNYQLVRMEAITYRQWTNAADWEWTFGSGTTKRSLNRGFVAGSHGYALYWTANDSDWNTPELGQARQTAFDSFQPAP
ncbi:serine/threonine protein kinase, partial [Kitasatospora sp. NPDC058965]